jgi:glucose/arabinose dehydrogenase
MGQTLAIAAKALVSFAMVGPALAWNPELVADSLSAPVFLTAPTGDSRLFVVEKAGRIQMLSGGTASTYLDISSLVDDAGEGGLLGLAFAPDFASTGRLYVNYIDDATKRSTVASFTAASALAERVETSTRQTVLTVAQPAGLTNHKGGWIGFRSSDPGQLYIATGDGGGGNDPQNRAQNLSDNLGKILRITPLAEGGYSVPDTNPFAGATPGNDEIWAYGLRNPYRVSFDRLSGDFWIADVGQGAREEVNFESAATAGGRNYGWRLREGSIPTPGVGGPAPGATDSIFEYASGTLGRSIIGGYVYHGTGDPALDGSYVFGDFVSGRIFALKNGVTTELASPFGGNTLTSFGEDGMGNLYAMGLNGNVFRVATVPEPTTWAMLASGLLVVALWRRRLRSAPSV